MRHERSACRPVQLSRKAELPGHDRSNSVGPYHDSRVDAARRVAGLDRHANRAAAVVALDVLHGHGFHHPRTGGTRSRQQHSVEEIASHGKPVVRKRPEPMRRLEPPLECHTFHRVHTHACELRCPGGQEFVHRVHLVEDPPGLGAQVRSARLPARKLFSVENERVDAVARQRPGGRGAGGAATNHDDFGASRQFAHRTNRGMTIVLAAPTTLAAHGPDSSSVCSRRAMPVISAAAIAPRSARSILHHSRSVHRRHASVPASFRTFPTPHRAQ